MQAIRGLEQRVSWAGEITLPGDQAPEEYSEKTTCPCRVQTIMYPEPEGTTQGV